MKKLFPVLIVFLPGLLMAQLKAVKISNLKGMASNYDGSMLRDDLVVNAQNVLFDQDLGPVKFNGFARENTVTLGSQPVSEMGQFIDNNGNEYLVVVSSNILAYDVGNGTFTTIISTLNSTFAYQCVSALNRFICTSSTNAVYWTGGSGVKTVDVSTSPNTFPLGKLIEKHANRVWVSGTSTGTSILYGSGFLNADSWALGPNAGDPVQIPVGLNDGDSITCLKSFADGLVVGKRNSMWAVIGKSQNDFTVVNLHPSVGCIQNKSMNIKQNRLFWLSKRGIEKLDGGIITLVSDPIKDITDKVISGYDATVINSVVDQSQGDFSAGISTYIAIVANPVSIQVSSPAVDFSTVVSQAINNEPSWWDTGNNNGAIAMSFSVKSTASVLGASINLTRLDYQCPSIGMRMFISSGNSSSGGTFVPSRIHIATGANSGSNFTCTGSGVKERVVYGDTFFSSNSLLYPGTTFWIVLQPTAVLNASAFRNFYTDSSSDPFVRSSSFVISSNYFTSPNPTWSFQTTNNKFSVILSSAQFTSSVKDLGTSVKSVSFFNSNFVLNDGKISFYARGAPDVGTLQSTDWAPQVLGATAAVNGNRFVQWRSDFGITTATQAPAILSVTIQYVSAANKQNSVSWVVDDRYYLSCSTSSNARDGNETVIVLDKFDNFTKLNDLRAASYAEAFQSRFFGTSTSTGAQSGEVMKMASALNYDGNPINSFIETKDYCGGDCTETKEWALMYVKTRSGSSGGTLSTQFQFDHDGNYNSLGDISLTEGTGIINARLPFPLGAAGVLGKTVRFKFSNNQVNQDFRLYEAVPFYETRPLY